MGNNKVGRPGRDTIQISLRVWGEIWEKLKDEPNRTKLINSLLAEHYAEGEK